MSTVLQLPIIDLSLPEKLLTSRLIRQACLNHGFFYLKNHGVPDELMKSVFKESKNLFSLPLDEKMVMVRRRGLRGYSPLYDDKGDPKELFAFGSSEGVLGQQHPNKWPSEDLLPLWRPTMERYYKSVVDVGKKLLGLVALALDFENSFFERLGAFNDQAATVTLLRYSGELNSSEEEEEEERCGASAHSDFGMLTLLATDGVPGLQVLAFISHNLLIKKDNFLHCSNKWLHTKKVCRDKDKEPNVWEDVSEIKGSTMHRMLSVGKERYSVSAGPNDYFHERFSQTLISYSDSA
ncbi:hypothetical protein HA466_0254380 [Hirschfeldia incana]|nr:hypothetical protein HA466_0254380 [Hirschfeldia incana]